MTPLLFGILGIGLFSAAREEVRKFERDAATEIAAKLEGADKHVTVRAKVGPEAVFGDVHSVRIEARNFITRGLPLYTEPKRSQKGRIGTLDLELRDFELSKLRVARFAAVLKDSRFDFALAARHRQVRLSRSGVGPGEVCVTQEALADFIRFKFPEVKEVKVTLDRGQIVVEGFGEFLFLSTHFWLAARLEPRGGDQMVLAFPHLLLDGKPADEASRDALIGVLNPVVDLSRDLKLYGAIEVREINVQKGQLIARGPTRIPDLPDQNVRIKR